MPYWYISVYIFHPIFYKSADSLLLISLCLCLTISSSLVASAAVNNDDSYILDFRISKIATALQIGCFSLLIIVSYISKIEFGNSFKFYGFVIIYFGMLILTSALTSGKEKDKEKEEQKEETKK